MCMIYKDMLIKTQKGPIKQIQMTACKSAHFLLYLTKTG